MNGQEWLNGNMERAYPFVDGQLGLHRVGQEPQVGFPLGAIVDALITTPAAADFYLTAAELVDQTSVRLVVGSVTLTGQIADLESEQFYTVLTGSDTDEDGNITQVRLVCCGARLMNWMRQYTLDQPIQFLTSCISTDELQVRSLTAVNPLNSFTLTDDILLGCGYNVDGTTQTTDVPDTTTITLAAIPGAGLGRVPCSDIIQPTAYVRGLPGLTPYLGNIQVEAGPEGCYEVIPINSAGHIQLYGNCDPCCTCDDYLSILEALRQMGVRITSTLENLTDGRLVYEEAVTTFNRDGRPGAGCGDLTLELYGIRGADYLRDLHGRILKGSPNYARLVIKVINRTCNSLNVGSLQLVFTEPAGLKTIEAVNWECGGAGGFLVVTAAELAAGLTVQLPPAVQPVPSISPGHQLLITVSVRAGIEWVPGETQFKCTANVDATDLTSEELPTRHWLAEGSLELT